MQTSIDVNYAIRHAGVQHGAGAIANLVIRSTSMAANCANGWTRARYVCYVATDDHRVSTSNCNIVRSVSVKPFALGPTWFTV